MTIKIDVSHRTIASTLYVVVWNCDKYYVQQRVGLGENEKKRVACTKAGKQLPRSSMSFPTGLFGSPRVP
jgi:hypothetical protein